MAAGEKAAAGGIYRKLIEVQREMKVLVKDETNPFFNSKYADINKIIETVKPIMDKHGIIVMQPLTYLNGCGDTVPAITTKLIDADTGECIESTTPIPFTSAKAQDWGSAFTYWRRYSLQAMLLLQAEDDDGNTASGKKSAPRKGQTSPFGDKPPFGPGSDDED